MRRMEVRNVVAVGPHGHGCAAACRWLILVAMCGWTALIAVTGAQAQQRPLALDALRSGVTFSGNDVRAMQADDAANPGMLWVGRGSELWQANCASCHGQAQASMRGVAARYPAYDPGAGAMLDLEGRIEQCRTARQKAPAFGRESDDLLSLTTFVAHQSRGVPLHVSVDGSAQAAFERGRDFYVQRHGQMNIACAQCHDENWGRKIWTENVSQGHPTAFPAYRLEWQSLGSLDRRIRACLFGVRARMPPAGSSELVDVALYLAWRAQGLPVETPGVRR